MWSCKINKRNTEKSQGKIMRLETAYAKSSNIDLQDDNRNQKLFLVGFNEQMGHISKSAVKYQSTHLWIDLHSTSFFNIIDSIIFFFRY